MIFFMIIELYELSFSLQLWQEKFVKLVRLYLLEQIKNALLIKYCNFLLSNNLAGLAIRVGKTWIFWGFFLVFIYDSYFKRVLKIFNIKGISGEGVDVTFSYIYLVVIQILGSRELNKNFDDY